MTGALTRKAQTRSTHGRFQLAERHIQVIVDYNKIELIHVTHFAQGAGHPPRYDIFTIRTALAQPAFQFRDRWRQDENADCFGELPAHLLRSLPVYLQQHVAPVVQPLLKPRARGAIKIAVYFSTLNKITVITHRMKNIHIHKVIGNTLLLTRTRRASGI